MGARKAPLCYAVTSSGKVIELDDELFDKYSCHIDEMTICRE